MCGYHCAQLSYTIQHRTFLIIITALMFSIGGEGYTISNRVNKICNKQVLPKYDE